MIAKLGVDPNDKAIIDAIIQGSQSGVEFYSKVGIKWDGASASGMCRSEWLMMWSAIIDILTALKDGDFGNAANLLI